MAFFFMVDENRPFQMTALENWHFCTFMTLCLIQKFRKCVIQKIIVLMNLVHYLDHEVSTSVALP